MTEHITSRDLADLKSMAQEGMTAREIAPMLGRTIGQTFRLLRTHRIPVRRERRPLTMMLVRRVRDCGELGLSIGITARIVDRSPTEIEGIHHRFGISVAPRPNKITTSVIDGCWTVLREAGGRIGDPPHRVAGGLLEIVSRRRSDLIERVLAPIATPSRTAAPISSLLSPMLEARI
jgi:hypothetical protein